MNDGKMIAVVGLGAVLPDAHDVASFWNNILSLHDSITEVPADRWNTDLFYDPDPGAVDKTYTKIGAFVKGYHFDPLKAGIAIPPRVLSSMDNAQQWAIAVSQQALKDYGYPEKKLDGERVAVIFGNSNAGEGHYRSTFRLLLPEYLADLQAVPDFANLPESVRKALLDGVAKQVQGRIPVITEDTMPGELSNIISGRVANVFNFSGPNFITDAACASSIAAVQAACEGLLANKFDAVLTGGIDRSMGPESYIKFCKIGALSADGSRPYAEGANGFVMGEGAVVFLLKRLEDAERDNDRIYAVIRGIGASSDGKGKGITAPNPLGQQRAIQRAWKDAGMDPSQVSLIEGHGTSTKVGDVAEVSSLNAVFGTLGLGTGSVALGSVKSNIGHLKSAAGAAGLLKTMLALHHQVLPPSANFRKPNPDIAFSSLPFRVNTQTQEWAVRSGNFRFAGVSAFGFGGTNFHVVLEEYFPGVGGAAKNMFAIPKIENQQETVTVEKPVVSTAAAPVQTVQTVDTEAVRQYVLAAVSEKTGYPAEMLDPDLDLEADLGIDTVKQAELFASIRTHYGIPRRENLRLSEYNTLAKVVGFVTDALQTAPAASAAQENVTPAPEATRPIAPQSTDPLQPYQGLYFASADTSANLYDTLQKDLLAVQAGSIPASRCPSPEQLAKPERIAIDYAQADELIKRLEKAVAAAREDNPASWKALQAHSIYRGSGQAGKVAFLFSGQGSQYVNMLLDLRETEPVVKDTFDEADRVMEPILGKPLTSYIYTTGGEAELAQAEKELKNTAITQPAMLTADVAMLRTLMKYGVQPDMVIGHSLGEYAALVAAGVLSFAEALEVVSARGREMTKIKLDDPGCMAAVSAPLNVVEEVIQSIPDYIVIANINSPVQCVLGGTTQAVDQALVKFSEAGYQAVKIPVSHAFHTRIVAPASQPLRSVIERMNIQAPKLPIVANVTGEQYPSGREAILDLLASQVASPVQFVKSMQTLYAWGARIFIESGPKRVLSTLAADNLKDKEDIRIIPTNHPRKGGKASFNEALCSIYAAGIPQPATPVQTAAPDEDQSVVVETPLQPDVVNIAGELPITGSVVITGAGLGLPGKDRHVFDDANIASILNGDMRIEALPEESRAGMLEKRITRLVKSEAGAVMETITDIDQVLKLAGQSGEFDLTEEFGVPAERVDALDRSTQLAMAAGIEALRDAGIPLVMSYRKTSKGTLLPNGWKLPECLQEETGVVFCSAFPGLNRTLTEAKHYYQMKLLENQWNSLKETSELVYALNPTGQTDLQNDLQRRILETEAKMADLDYHFDRRYIFRILAMGHSQFAEYIGAKGPNTHVNAACATTTQGVCVAEDWIRTGRARRVIVIAGDDVTNTMLTPWIGSSLFASGAATAEGDVRMAALPFDKRRNGLIMGMGAAALVIESEDAARERGISGIGEILSTVFANSAFHGTQLDVQHVSRVMDRLLTSAEKRFGIRRGAIADQTVFVSHETYTPARGGSASAEIHALRSCFGDQASRVVIANTKGFTGHTMGVGVEDVIAVKTLETGLVPPVAHIHEGFEPDEELGDLRLSQGGAYHPQFFLRLGAGFGSQIAMTLVRRIPGAEQRVNQAQYNRWLSAAAGVDQAELEVVQRTLRVKSQGMPVQEPAGSTWQYGQLPRLWASAGSQAAEAVEVLAVQKAQPVTEAQVESAPVAVQQAAHSRINEQPETQPSAGVSIPVSASAEEIKQYVLSAVSEKTGYPVEMLDFDLDLEADLGIDTVKQAELFASLRAHYNIPRREDMRLSDYNTLAKVVAFMENGLAQNAQVTETPSAEINVKQIDLTIADVTIADETAASEAPATLAVRKPTPVLLPRLDLCLPTGIQIEDKHIVVVSEPDETCQALTDVLERHGAVAHRISLPEDLAALKELSKAGQADGMYFLPGLQNNPAWADDTAWQTAVDTLTQALHGAALELPRSAFILAGTRMGGLHGLLQPINPLGGLVSGFFKALRRERSEQLIKVIDFEADAAVGFTAGQLLAETLHDPVHTEVGREDGQRYVISLQNEDPQDAVLPQPLREGSVFVVSGGTGGITGAVVRDLAKATRGTFYLLSRTVVDAQDADLAAYRQDPAAYRAALQNRLLQSGQKVTPVQLEQKISALERVSATVQVVQDVEKMGGKAVCLACDITDPQAVDVAVQTIAARETQVDVFLHAAGLEISRKIESKSQDEVRQTVRVKVDGLRHVLRALEGTGRLPDRTVFFSSVAGRFGNSGQTDYSAANDALNKYAAWLGTQYPGMQAISIDWGAWAEVGMASRGRIPDLMKLAGIEMMDPRSAAPMLRQQLENGRSGEILISGSLGRLEEMPGNHDGMDISKADQALRAGTPIHQMLSHLTDYSSRSGIRLDAELNPQELAFLRDHSINGVPVLPGVVGIDGFSVAAKHIASVLGSADSEFEVEQLENIQFLAPFKFYGGKPRSMSWFAFPYRTAQGLTARVSLESDYERWNGQLDHTVHFSGIVHLAASHPLNEVTVEPPKWGRGRSISSEEIYRLFFHGPAFQVLEAAQASQEKVLGRLNKQVIQQHAGGPVLKAVPALIELCFQTAGLYEVGATGVMALPHSVGSLKVYNQHINGLRIYAEVVPYMTGGQLSFDARVVDAKGNLLLEIQNYQTSPMPEPAELQAAEPMKALVGNNELMTR